MTPEIIVAKNIKNMRLTESDHEHRQNIIKNMPVVALPSLYQNPPQVQVKTVESIKTFGAEKVETEDGWVAC